MTNPISSYLKYLPPALWSPQAAAGGFDLGSMLCVFEKMLTGIADGVVIGHGDNTVLTTVIQSVRAGPAAQTVRVTAGTGGRLDVGSSYTFQGTAAEVINVVATTANSITAIFQQDHAAQQAIVASTGPHPDIQSLVANLGRYYGAWSVPPEAFGWLAQWVALQDDPVWDDYQRRAALSKIVGIYSQRGTRSGFDRFFETYAVARQRPRVVVDDSSKILFCRPAPGSLAPTPTLVSQRPLVAPQCLAIDTAGRLLVGDLGSNDGSVAPAIWRVSRTGDYDYAAGPVPRVQPCQTANAPVAIAADPVNGGAYLLDLVQDYSLRRLSAPQLGTVTLAGAPAAGATGTFTVGGVAFTVAQAGGATLANQAATWAAALNGVAAFSARYVATSNLATIAITALSAQAGDDLMLVTTSSPALQMSASGPAFSLSSTFATNSGGPPTPLGLRLPRGMVVNAAGSPLILDRGALIASPSATRVVEAQVNGSPPVYAGAVVHALPAIAEPLCMALRGDGSLVVGDGANQISGAPADLWAVDPVNWTATSLLAGVPAADNPIVAPVGIVETGAQVLMVLDAGLRPYVPSAVAPFTAIIARQAAIWRVDLSTVPPTITQASEFGAGVYPRAMVGDAQGTLYFCDSGLPDLAGYSARKWRSKAQEMAVVVHFQSNPSRSISSLTLSGAPTAGNACSVTVGAVAVTLQETGGDTLPQQAQAWADTLNATAAFNALYVALPIGNIVCLYALSDTSSSGVAVATASSASVTLSAGRLGACVTLAGVPTTGNRVVMNVAGVAYQLAETTGSTLAQQAATWAAALNALTPFNVTHVASAAGAVLSVYYRTPDVSDNLASFFTRSASVSGTLAAPPTAIGTVGLSGTPTGGETCTINVGLLSIALPESGGVTLEQQALAWVATLNTNAVFAANYAAMNAGPGLMLFAGPAVGPAGSALSAVSSAHLVLSSESEGQDRARFLQSIRDVAADEVPAHARWYLQSDLSQL